MIDAKWLDRHRQLWSTKEDSLMLNRGECFSSAAFCFFFFGGNKWSYNFALIWREMWHLIFEGFWLDISLVLGACSVIDHLTFIWINHIVSQVLKQSWIVVFWTHTPPWIMFHVCISVSLWELNRWIATS
jgi:hypothetical protein